MTMIKPKPKHDPTLVEWVADILSSHNIKVHKINRDKGTINISTVSSRAVHKLTFERV